MIPRRAARAALAAAALLLSGCFKSDLEKARRDFYAGNPAAAARRLEEAAHSRGRNQALYLLERGTCLQAAGNLEESTADFLEAVRKIRDLEVLSASGELFALWWSDLVRPYDGEPYEKVLARSFLMMNYFALREPWEAQVEARNAVRILDDPATPEWAQDPFTRYLCAIAFDLGGHSESAYLEYKRVQALRPEFPFVKAPLLRLARSTGRPEDRARWEKLPGPDSDRKEGHGMLVLFVQTGAAPEKVAREAFIPPYYRISVPAFQERPGLPASGAVQPKGSGAGAASALLTSVERVAVKTLEDRTAKELAREAVRQAANEAAARGLESGLRRNLNDGYGPGLAAGVALAERIGYALLHRADTRSWQTLPAALHVAQTLLPAGQHEVEIRFLSASGSVVKTELRPAVEIKDGLPTFLIARAF